MARTERIEAVMGVHFLETERPVKPRTPEKPVAPPLWDEPRETLVSSLEIAIAGAMLVGMLVIIGGVSSLAVYSVWQLMKWWVCG